MKTLHFMAGLPRSGQTLLAKILNQHPDIYTTPTSPILEYLIPTTQLLYNIKENHAAGKYINTKNIISSSVHAFYDTNKPIVIDKNRGWITNYECIDQDLVSDPKIILTLRPIEEVVTSFFKILNVGNTGDETPEQIYYGRVASVVETLMQKSYLKDKVHIVTYRDLIRNTTTTLYDLETFIGSHHFEYNINNISDQNPEDDEKWGITGLHDIRSTISEKSMKPEDIMTNSELNFCKQLTKELYDAYGLST